FRKKREPKGRSRTPGPPCPLVCLGGAADRLADRVEGLVGGRAQGGDGHQADHHDQGQHDGVLDRRGAVFRLQEVDDLLTELTHDSFYFGVEYQIIELASFTWSGFTQPASIPTESYDPMADDSGT